MASEEAQALKLNHIDDFLSYHTPALKAALWIHSEESPEKSMPYHGYNYLFDGMLDNIKELEKSGHHIFFGEQFSSPFFLGLIKEGSNDMSNFLNQLEQTIGDKLSENDRVLILTPLGKAMPMDVKKKLKKYKLSHLTYTL